ncbi:MAG TPA: hypothetical protein VFR79_13145 [Nitrospira sp.]|nr:hypothetical protein [Nitrospira sp.]
MPPDGSEDTPLLFVVTGMLVFLLSAGISQYVPVVDIGQVPVADGENVLECLLQKSVVRRVGRAETERLYRWILHDIRMPVRNYFLYQQ